MSMNRRDFLMRAGGGGVLFGAALGARAQARPNLVVILVDDMGWMDLSCQGSRYYETPNIDRLAREGMRFTQGYAACAVCSPTRFSMLTGRYPARSGVTDWIRPASKSEDGAKAAGAKVAPTEYVGTEKTPLLCPPNAFWMELDEVTIAEVLRGAGYTTCQVGKWHLGPEPWHPDKQGFDLGIGGCDYGQPPSYFDPYKNETLDGIPTLPSRKPGEHLIDREADEAVGFVRAHTKGPFFLYWASYGVHRPLQGRKDLVEKYKKKPPTHQDNPEYAAMVEGLDRGVGRLLDVLKAEGILDNTLIWFTSDNGGLLGTTDNRPLRSGKGYPYEGGIREPLIVRWPGHVPAGSQCDVPACSIDVFPTLCEAAGVPVPKERPIDGVSLMPLLTRKGTVSRDTLYWHFPHYREPDGTPYGVVRCKDWKLIKWYEGPRLELYNLAEDLSEEHDCTALHPEVVRELDAKLEAWLDETHARRVKPNPAYAGVAKKGIQ